MMSSAPPFVTRWMGDHFKPLGRSAKDADATLVVGEVYRLSIIEDRNWAFHRAYFAQLAEIWSSLPEQLSAEYPDVETLRHRLLIKAGFSNSRDFVCTSNAEARRWAAYMSEGDKYAIIEVKRNVIRKWTAQSQSGKAMDKEQFKASADAVLEYGANLIRVSREALEWHAETQ